MHLHRDGKNLSFFQSINQSIEILPPTQGACLQHILRAHLQAKIWAQDTVINPDPLDPTHYGWRKEECRLV